MISRPEIWKWLQDRPDPNLLPLLSQYVPTHSIWDVAQLADVLGSRGGLFPPWLPLAEQTAQALAARWQEFDCRLAEHILDTLPRTAFYLDETHRSEISGSELVELPCVAACIARANGDGSHAERLAEKYFSGADPYERRGLSLLLPLLEEPQKTRALELVLEDDTVFGIRGWADLARDKLLTDHGLFVITETIRKGLFGPPLIAAATLAPILEKEAARKALLSSFQEETPYGLLLPDWYIAAILTHAGYWLEESARRVWVDALGDPYRSHISRYLKELPNTGRHILGPVSPVDIVQSHPAAIEIAEQFEQLPEVDSEAISANALRTMIDIWAGAPPTAAVSIDLPSTVIILPDSLPTGSVTSTSAPSSSGQGGSPPRLRKKRRRSLWDRIRGVPIDEPTLSRPDRGKHETTMDDIDEASLDDTGSHVAVPDRELASDSDETSPSSGLTAPERFVQAAILHESKRRLTFVAGERNEIVFWIGPKEVEASRRATSDEPVREDVVPVDGLALDVVLTTDDQSQIGKILLPKDPRLRTADCILPINVPSNDVHIVAEIAFLHMGRAFEIVRIDAPVLQPGEIERGRGLRLRVQVQRRDVLDLTDRERFDAIVMSTESSHVVFGPRGSGRFTLEHTEPAIAWLNDEIFATEKSLIRRHSNNQGSEPTLDATDAETLGFLRDLARHGNNLYKDLRHQGFQDPGERIQLLNLEPTAHIPMEFVYDRGHPVDGAALCSGWANALASDDPHCATCKPASELSAEERDGMPTICPLGFWSLQKIIERHDSSVSGSASPIDGAAELLPITRTLFASSNFVDQLDRDQTLDILHQSFDAVAHVEDWDSWKSLVQKEGPELFVALPHHSITGAIDALEIGNGSQLLQDRLSELYVTRSQSGPGPIIVLFGCETQRQAEMGYVSFARDFARHRAAVVIGTLAKVLGRHAAPVVQSLVQELALVDKRERIGIIMRRLRRRMLARGYLMALCLVALGDGDWWLSPAPNRVGSHVSH